jgi:hypothetical protein
MSLGRILLAALVLMGFALAMSRRSLPIAAVLCFVALVFLGYGMKLWLAVQ